MSEKTPFRLTKSYSGNNMDLEKIDEADETSMHFIPEEEKEGIPRPTFSMMHSEQ